MLHLKIRFFLKDTCMGKRPSWITDALALMDKSSYKWSTEKLGWQNRRESFPRLLSPSIFQCYKLTIPQSWTFCPFLMIISNKTQLFSSFHRTPRFFTIPCDTVGCSICNSRSYKSLSKNQKFYENN